MLNPCRFMLRLRPPLRRGVRAIFAIPVTIGLLNALVTITVGPKALATDGLEPIGVSTQSRMRGGADVAVGDSPLSQIDNPATLSLSPHDMYALDTASQLAFVTAPVGMLTRLDKKSIQCPVLPLRRQLVPPWKQADPIGAPT